MKRLLALLLALTLPLAYRESFGHPLFRAGDLSPQVLARRVYDHREAGGEHVAAALFGLPERLPAAK